MLFSVGNLSRWDCLIENRDITYNSRKLLSLGNNGGYDK